jgi:hypothetical protein
LRRITAKCKRDAAHTGNFKEGAPIHIKKDLPKRYRWGLVKCPADRA